MEWTAAPILPSKNIDFKNNDYKTDVRAFLKLNDSLEYSLHTQSYNNYSRYLE